MKNTFVINYGHMDVGGIENYASQVIELGLEQGCRVIWLCDAQYSLSSVYAPLMNDPRVEKCRCSNHGMTWFRHEPLHFTEEENVIIFSFSFFDQARALQLKNEMPDATILPLLLVPHFLGSDLYPEKAFHGFGRTCVCRLAGKLYQQWLQEGLLYAFSLRHLDVIEKNYGIVIERKQERIVPLLRDGSPFSEEEVAARYDAADFTIISAGRLEFPHKGFVLGLLREYARLKKKYPFLKLKIIGEGEGEAVLRKEISEMPAQTAADVQLCPMVPFEVLCEEFKKAKLNISVAGCASAAAKLGVLTLPARNYHYDCEVYGFFPESRACTTEDKPGEPVAPYIERVIHMTKEEYVQLSRKAYETMAVKHPDRAHFLKLSDAGRGYSLSEKTLRQLYGILMAQRLLYKLHLLKE